MQITEKHINTLKELTSELINSDSGENVLILKEKIIKLTEKIFINSDEKKFEIIFVNNVLKELLKRGNELSKYSTNFSRSTLHLHNLYIQVNSFSEYLLEYYSAYLKDNFIYQSFISRKDNEKNPLKSSLFTDLDYNVDFDKFIKLKESKNQILKYFEELEKQSNFSILNYQLIAVFDRIKETISKLRNKITINDTLLEKQNKDENYNDDEIDYYISLSNDKLVYEKQSITLNELKYSLERKFPFITYKSKTEPLLNYFNHNKINDFLEIENRLIENEFLEKSEFELTWKKKKVELVNFCRELFEKGYIKKMSIDNEKAITKLITFFEHRYNINTGDQKKPTKRNKNIDETVFINIFP